MTSERAGTCSGRLDCSASLHVHGCYADFGGCDSPEEHPWPSPSVAFARGADLDDSMTSERAGKRTFTGRAPRSRLDRIKCSECDAIVGGRVPKGGDGSGLFPVRHLNDGVPCDGSLTEGKWLDDE